jgi:protein-tyrosine phosphatase
VIQGGYRPIIAHTERCAAIRSDIDLLRRLVELGVRVQINAGSLLGEDGLALKWFCRTLMKRHLIHYVASDSHNKSSRRPNLGKCAAYIERVMGRAYRDQIMTLPPTETIERSARK